MSILKIIKPSLKTFSVAFLACAIFLSSFPVGEFFKNPHGRIVDKLYLSKIGKKVIDNFGAKTAGAATASTTLQYMLNIGPVTASTAASRNHISFFNPSGSGKTTIVKKIRIQTNTVNTANYHNISLRRITAASGGTTQISAANIPKKNSDSSNSIMEVRMAGPVVTYAQASTTEARMLAVVAAGAAGGIYSKNEQDFGTDENIILQPGEGLGLLSEAAGDADQRISMYVEWQEQTDAPSTQGEYMLNYPRIAVAAGVGYTFGSFFNPGGSGKTAVVKRLSIDVDCDGTAVYTNNISLRRITAASGGTQISAANIPKKHTGTGNSIVEARHTNPAATFAQASTTEARILNVTPCGAAGQPHGHRNLRFANGDEKLVLQPGEGVALISETAGDVNQLVRWGIEWDEETDAPSTQGEYMMNYPRVELAAAANAKYHTFFNPSASGKTAVIKRVGIYIDNDNGGGYQGISIRRITSASAGSQISAANIPKKHTGTGDSAMELRYNNVTAATSTSSSIDKRLVGLTGPGAVGQIIGQKEVIFATRENLVLKPGEGIALMSDAAGDVDQYVKLFVEWDEEASSPATENEYMTSIGQVSGNAGSNYVYAAFYNPPSSATTTLVKRFAIRVDSAATATSIPFSLMRISTSSAGTLITSANIEKKNSSSTNSVMEIRRTGVTVTYSGSIERLTAVTAPSTVGAATAPAVSGQLERVYTYNASSTQESLVLKPGEGIALRQEGTGFTGHRVFLDVEWQEVSNASAPEAENEFVFSSPRMTASTSANYVYGALYNPANSGKNFIMQRMEARVHATTSAVYVAASFRRISTSSNSTLVDVNNIAKKNNATATSTAEVRYLGTTVSLSGATESRLLTVITPGAVNQASGILESSINTDDELIIKPGEGIAFYQEAAGDTDQMYFFEIQWKEVEIYVAPVDVSFSGTIYGIDESTPLASQPIVALAINGSSVATTTAAVDGTFTIANITQPSNGAMVVIWLNTNGGDQATLVFNYGSSCGGGNCSGLSLYKNRVIIENRHTAPISNTLLADCDNDTGSACSDSDIGFTATTSLLSLTWTLNTLRLATTTANFVPGGQVNALNYNQSAGSFNGGSSNLTFDGSFIVSGGIATSTSGSLRVANDITRSGSGKFNHNNGEVVLLSPWLNTTISGMGTSTTGSFYNLRIDIPDKTVKVAAEEILLVENHFVLGGQPGVINKIMSTVPSSKWYIKLLNTSLFNFAGIADAGCAFGGNNPSVTPEARDFGNNGPCWTFVRFGGGGGGNAGAPPPPPPDDPLGGGGGGNQQGGGGFGGGGGPGGPPPCPPDDLQCQGGGGDGGQTGGSEGGGGGGAAP